MVNLICNDINDTMNDMSEIQLTMNIKDSGMVSRTGIVGSYAGIVATVAGGGSRDGQKRSTRSHFSSHDAEVRRGIFKTMEVPLDVKRQVTLRHMTIELDRLAGEHRLVCLEGYDVWQYC